MELFLEIIKNQFVWGIALGLLIAFFVWKGGHTAKSHLKKENKRLQTEADDLQGHLNRQLKINAAGNESLEKELKELKEQNENLRVNLSTLQQKPDKAEMRHLHVTESAVSKMREQAPGFASAWEQAMRSAEEDYTNAEGGFSKLVKKVLPKIGGSSEKAIKTIEVEES